MTTDPWPNTIREINDLSPENKEAIYRTLLPDWLFSFGEQSYRD
jgi:hypothetical protein